MKRILVTGAAGGVATLLRPRLRHYALRLLDLVPIPDAEDAEVVECSVTDLDALTAACTGVDVVLHLGGHSKERDWESIADVNIHGTRTMLEAARLGGVTRVILASSNHAVGFHPTPIDTFAPDYMYPRPDTWYGVSKVAMEALGSVYHDRYGMDVACIRIGSCFEKPHDTRMLGTWLSPDDCARLVTAIVEAPELGFRIVWGVSNNTRRIFSLDEARALGYAPQDDSEIYADTTPAVADPRTLVHIGGGFCFPYENEE